MPENNRFQHQQYPTSPAIMPVVQRLTVDAPTVDFSTLHTDLGVGHVVLVHGTFMGDDSFAVAETLRSIAAEAPILKKSLEAIATRFQDEGKPFADKLAGDIGNYTSEFRDRFQRLVGDDPHVRLMDPTWSGQNHHLARADLAVRLLCELDTLQPDENQKVMLWGHSHAGNGFAILSNLLANDRQAVDRFFEASEFRDRPHWLHARRILKGASSPHHWSNATVIVAFGTPVRYGWDTAGYRQLLHVLHHRIFDQSQPFRAKPMFPPHTVTDMMGANFGDWIQAFGIAGTDVAPPVLMSANTRMGAVLETGLAAPSHGVDTRFIPGRRIRDTCARWKTGTRCHADGQNLLVQYAPSGRIARLILPVEEVLLGHGVATTVDWLPAHLSLVCQQLSRVSAP